MLKLLRLRCSEVYALEHGRLLKEHGFEVDIIGQYVNIQRVRDNGANPIVVKTWFKKGYSRRISFDRKVTRLLKKNNYDLVFGHGDNFHQDILFPHNCVHLAHELVHGSPLDSNDSVGLIHAELFQNGTFKQIIANSYLMKNDLIERFNIETDLIDVVHPGFS